MKRNSHATAPSGLFIAGSLATQTPATVITHDWCNDVQEELVNIIEGAGLSLDGNNDAQLLAAVDALIAAAEPAYAIYGVSGGGINNALFTLTATSQSTGFAVASDVVTFPRVGVYHVSIDGLLTNTDTANPTAGSYRVKIASSVAAYIGGRRWSASTADTISVQGSCLVVVGNTSTDTLTLTYSGNGTSATATASTMWIHRVR